MTQNLGSTSNPLSMTGEQWVLEERTDDPLSPDPGECWIRTDLNAGDKIATLKFGDGSEVPIFPTGTSEPGVLEVRRVQTGGQTGYLPVAEPDESRFPQLRLQHNNTVYSLHNDIEPSAIPDSVVSRDEDNGSNVRSLTLGVQIESDDEWAEIGGQLSANTADATRAYIYRTSDGVLMDDVDITGLTAGDTFTLAPDLAANTTYNFVVDAEGADYTNGLNDSPTFPYESSDGRLRITNGASGVDGSSSAAHNIVTVGNVGFD